MYTLEQSFVLVQLCIESTMMGFAAHTIWFKKPTVLLAGMLLRHRSHLRSQLDHHFHLHFVRHAEAVIMEAHFVIKVAVIVTTHATLKDAQIMVVHKQLPSQLEQTAQALATMLGVIRGEAQGE